MSSRLLLTAILSAGLLAVVAAQALPPAPKNLRIVTGKAPKLPAVPSCVVLPPATGKPAHAYYESLVKRPEHVCNWSLRDQALLNSLTNDPVSTFFTYSPATDAYPQKQDAAKFFVPAGLPTASIPGKQQLKFPIPGTLDSGTLLITWDWYWGPEFRSKRGAMNTYKMFRFLIAGHRVWTLGQSPGWEQHLTEPNQVALQWDSGLGGEEAGTLAAGMVRREPWTPTGSSIDQRKGSGSQFAFYDSRWSRYWVEIRMLEPPEAFSEWNQRYGVKVGPNPSDAQGRWMMVSQWVADDARDPVRLLYRVPMSWKANWDPRYSRFDFELNTSESTGFIGPWVGYARNVVMLHNYKLPAVNPESDKFIFQRPTR